MNTCRTNDGTNDFSERTQRLVAVILIDFFIHIICFWTLLKTQASLPPPEWNITAFSGYFIYLACLDGTLLLWTIYTLNNKCARVIWRLTRMVYIISLLQSWYVNVKSVYQQRQHDSELQIYLFLGSFITFVLPFCYFYYLSEIKECHYNQVECQIDNPHLTKVNNAQKPYGAYIFIMILLHPIFYIVLEHIKLQQRQHVHYFHTYFPPPQAFSS